MRSMLFVPGNRRARFDKACAAGADVVIVDLEDAVAPDEKAMARESLRQWLGPEKRVYVRVNGADTEWFAADLELLMLPGVAGVVLPKTENTEVIATVVAVGGGLPVVPLIETALGLWNIERIARAPCVSCLAFGSVDFQLDTGISGEVEELLFARSQLVLVSRVAGIAPPIDGVTVAIDDEVALAADVGRAKRLGFRGKLCLHPKQVAMVNAGFSPQQAELVWARQVVAAAKQAAGNAVRLDGQFIDMPIIERARALLDAADKASIEGSSEVLEA